MKECFERNKALIDPLNDDLENVKISLEKYLTNQENNANINGDLIKEIGCKIYSKISLRDLSDSSIENWANTIIPKIGELKNADKIKKNNYYKFLDISDNEALDFAFGNYFGVSSYDIKNYLSENKIPDYFLLPNNYCFLNFNYTHTPKNYVTNDSNIEYISIHGELNNPNNPIIFGYGDELDEEYKKIENLNDNKFMENIKSVKYLETDNYKRLLSFIDSEPYQVCIMGHSCGNSDRTLLNTLFEHKNCTSIKPYYYSYKKDDVWTDNYSDIVRNISRNFKDKQLLRERVVNKKYCEPLVIIKDIE